MIKLLIASGVHWRHWDDGIVVFVSATCETHVLSPSLLPIFQENSYDLAREAGEGVICATQLDCESSELQAVIEQLVRLKIIEIPE